MTTNPDQARKGQLLARALGSIAGLLAWTAAGIRYSNDGTVSFSLIAAGLFFGLLGFMSKASPPTGNG